MGFAELHLHLEGTIDRETGEIKYGAYPRFTPIYAPTTRYPFDWEPIVRGIGGLVGLVLIVGLIWNLFFTGILDKNYGNGNKSIGNTSLHFNKRYLHLCNLAVILHPVQVITGNER